MSDKVTKTEEEWRAQLSPEQFNVTRQAGTESAFSGKYWDSKAPGTYGCVCCGAELFSSKEKYESDTIRRLRELLQKEREHKLDDDKRDDPVTASYKHAQHMLAIGLLQGSSAVSDMKGEHAIEKQLTKIAMEAVAMEQAIDQQMEGRTPGEHVTRNDPTQGDGVPHGTFPDPDGN